MAGHDHPHQHDHPHDHPHDHSHDHAPEAKHVVQRGAVLEIGGDVGAVLVHSGPELEGEEIELYTPAGAYVMHTEVHAREVAGRTQHAGLFPTVRQGDYLLDLCDGSERRPLTVTGGQVAVVGRVRSPASSMA